jgi:hypothetical protein
MSSLVLFPSLPPPSIIEIPEDMDPENEARLLKELGEISRNQTRLETVLEEREKQQEQRHRATEARLAKLEKSADASGQHDVALMQRALDKKDEAESKLKWWVLSIIGTLLTSAAVGLVVHYLSTK